MYFTIFSNFLSEMFKKINLEISKYLIILLKYL